MYALCLESSHQRGMGHLFRGIHLYHYIVGQKGKKHAIAFSLQKLSTASSLFSFEVATTILNCRAISYNTIVNEHMELMPKVYDAFI